MGGFSGIFGVFFDIFGGFWGFFWDFHGIFLEGFPAWEGWDGIFPLKIPDFPPKVPLFSRFSRRLLHGAVPDPVCREGPGLLLRQNRDLDQRPPRGARGGRAQVGPHPEIPNRNSVGQSWEGQGGGRNWSQLKSPAKSSQNSTKSLQKYNKIVTKNVTKFPQKIPLNPHKISHKLLTNCPPKIP